MQLVKVLYCKLPTIGKQLPNLFHMESGGLNRRPQSYHCATVAPARGVKGWGINIQGG